MNKKNETTETIRARIAGAEIKLEQALAAGRAEHAAKLRATITRNRRKLADRELISAARAAIAGLQEGGAK
jgi:hypothetical protein